MEFHAPLVAAIVAGAALVVLFGELQIFKWIGTNVLSPWLAWLPPLIFLGATIYGWVASYRRLRALEDTPVSKIGSAPQGYVKLQGRAQGFAGKPLESPIKHVLCCWYSCRIEEEQRDSEGNRHWHTLEHDTSIWSFMIADGSGECVIDPAHAEIIPVRVEKWREGNMRFTESVILPREHLIVEGKFLTSGGNISEAEINFKVSQLISSWKQDMASLLQRFDLDRDGKFSQQEWELVRAQARRDVEAELARDPPQPQNIVSKPEDDRPFIISAETEGRLETDFKLWAWGHLLGFLLGAAIAIHWAFHR